nr:ribonuclease H-like domain-containing protein [Tanacetum cinerariifolium]
MVTRAKARIFKPLERMNCHVTTTSSLLSSHVHALCDPNWKEAMLDEYKALITNGMWVLVPRLANVNVVRSMWLLKHKFHTDGSLSRYKARLVANGRSQQQGIDCDETFSPVVKPTTIRIVLSLARSKSGLFLSQSKFAKEILEWAHMQHCNPCKTPVDTESKLGSDGVPICLYMYDPRDPHFTALKRILCYVCGTLDQGLELHVSSTSQLTAFTDADWVGCPVTHRSTFGYCVFLGDNLLSCFAKRQIQNLLLELHASLTTATLVYCDNVSVVYLSNNPVQHQRTKHIEIDIHFVRDCVSFGQVCVLHVPSRFQYVDIFTKGLPSALFLEFRSSLNVQRPPVLTAREY